MTTFVLDTSVLLSDPGAMARFAEHEVVLPLVVVSELEGKRDHPELGWFARQALRMLDDLRIEHGRLDQPIPWRRARCGSSSTTWTPRSCRGSAGDGRRQPDPGGGRQPGGRRLDVVLVSKDLPLRVKAASIGLTAQEYRAELASSTGWTGMAELEVAGSDLDLLYADGGSTWSGSELPTHTGLVLLSERGSGLGRVAPTRA
jgi:PhoH-like ATPase